MNTVESIKKTLIDAKNLIIQHGWHQGSWGNREVGFCLIGAVGESSKDGYFLATTIALLKSHLAAESEVSPPVKWTQNSIVTWNDDPARTQTEVFQVLDQIIEKL